VNSQLLVTLRAGIRYYVLAGHVVGSPTLTTATDELLLSFSTNDVQTRPFVIPSTGTYANVQGVVESADPDVVDTFCDGGVFHDEGVWYSFKPSVTRVYEFSTAGSSYDSLITVYRLSDMAEIDCNNDLNTFGDPTYQSRVRPMLTAGTRYLIYIAQFSGGDPDERLTLNFTVRPR
jgi:hypothetical protein